MMMRQNNLNSNSTEAVRVLLAIEIILSPSSLSLPAVPATMAAKKYLNTSAASSLSFNNSNLVNLISLKDEREKEDREKQTDSTDDVTSQAAQGAFLEGNIQRRDRVKRGRDGEADDSDVIDEDSIKKKVKKDDNDSFVMNADIGAAFGKKNKIGKERTEKDDEEDDDDDDDSLPDIDIEADPEK